MKERRPISAAAIAFTVLGVLAVLLLTIYVAGYFWLSRNLGVGMPYGYRVYPSEWLTVVYEPAAKVESVFRGYEVDLIYEVGGGAGITGFD